MEFTKIINKSFQNIKTYRYQLGLGILAALSGGFGSMPNSTSNYQIDDSQTASQIAEQVSSWVSSHLEIIIAGSAIAIVIGILFLYLSLRAQAGLIKSTEQIEKREAHKNFSSAWKSAEGFAWRLFLLGLLLGIFIFGWLLVFFGVPTLLMYLMQYLPMYIFGGLLIFIGILGLVLAMFGFTPLYEFGKREIVIHNAGAYEAFVRSLRKIRDNIGNSILALVLSWLLSIAIGILILISVGLLGFVLFLIGWAVYSSLGLISTIAYGVILGIPFAAIALAVTGAAQAYFSNFWTLVYLELKK